MLPWRAATQVTKHTRADTTPELGTDTHGATSRQEYARRRKGSVPHSTALQKQYSLCFALVAGRLAGCSRATPALSQAAHTTVCSSRCLTIRPLSACLRASQPGHRGRACLERPLRAVLHTPPRRVGRPAHATTQAGYTTTRPPCHSLVSGSTQRAGLSPVAHLLHPDALLGRHEEERHVELRRQSQTHLLCDQLYDTRLREYPC